MLKGSTETVNTKIPKAFYVLVLCTLTCGCSPSQPGKDKQQQRAEAVQRSKEARAAFAANHGAIWPELTLDLEKEMLLAVDVQRRLTSSPVAVDFFMPDVREENGSLILFGTVLASVPVTAELIIDPQWLEVVRTNRYGFLWVAARIESVRPKREYRSAEDSFREEIVYYATGRAFAVERAK